MGPSEVASTFYGAASQCPSDFETMFNLLDENITWTLCAGHRQAGTHQGFEGFASSVQPGMDEDWTGGIVFLADHIVERDETCLVMGWFHSTSRHTGQPVKIRFAHRWLVRDGKAVEFEELLDTAMVLRSVA